MHRSTILRVSLFSLLVAATVLLGGCQFFSATPPTNTNQNAAVDNPSTDNEPITNEATTEDNNAIGDQAGTTIVENTDVTITLTAKNFEFSQKEIRVKLGDTVKVVFTSEQGFHDFVIEEFDAATERVSDGQTSSVTFVADQQGTFEYYCSVGSHRQMGMVGQLIVE